MKDVQDFYPLSPLQQGLLFHSLSDPASGMYFNQTRVATTTPSRHDEPGARTP
jgi:hypothetical protein